MCRSVFEREALYVSMWILSMFGWGIDTLIDTEQWQTRKHSLQTKQCAS